MPFISVCPYCRKGKIRAPEHMAGHSVDCPSCKTSFTLVMPDETDKYRGGPTPGAVESGKSATLIRPNVTPPKASPPVSSTTNVVAAANAAPAPTAPAPMPTITIPAQAHIPGEEDESAHLPALVAMIIGGVGMLATQLPYGRWIGLVFLAVGLVVGLLSIMSADRKLLYPFLGTGLNLLGIVVILLLPDWLGLRSAWDRIKKEDPNLVKAVDPITGLGITADWIDAGKSSWQQNDVRVSIGALTTDQLEVIVPNGDKRLTRDKFLQIPVTVTNVGVVRKVEFAGWDLFGEQEANKPAANKSSNPVPVISLKDGSGRVVAIKKPDPTLELTLPPPMKDGLFPGKSTVQILLFEVPDRTVTELKLELPGVPFGSQEMIRFKIPLSALPWKKDH